MGLGSKGDVEFQREKTLFYQFGARLVLPFRYSQ